MRCKYCHNPETWDFNKASTVMSVDDLYKKSIRYKNYWTKRGKANGGVTVSGGEPLFQIDFVTEYFAKLKKAGVHTTLDTSGVIFSDKEPFITKFNKLMKVTDLFMLDIKQTDTDKHIALTGKSNKPILDMARYLSDNGKDMWIRRVLVPGLTDDEKELDNLYKFISSLKTVRRTEILPYHTLGLFKWENIKVDYPLKGVPVPTDEQVKKAQQILHII